MPAPIDPFTLRVSVRASELDLTGLAAPAALLDYFQEAAGAHATVLGFGIDEMGAEGLTWVLTRLRLRIDRPPAWRDAVEVETWPSGTDGLYATREYLLRDAGGALAARATSDWLVLDVARRRPVRVSPRLLDLSLPDRERALPPLDGRLEPPASVLADARFPVRRSDLDLNRHVNNVRYAEWAAATLPEAFLETHRLAALDLHFRAETTAGDAVEVATGPAGDGAYAHRLTRSSDGREVALAHSRWVALGEGG